jgi:hypothetical protein
VRFLPSSTWKVQCIAINRAVFVYGVRCRSAGTDAWDVLMTLRGLHQLVLAISFLGWPHFGNAATPWPDEPKRSYIEICAESLSSQRVAIDKAKSFCTCAAEGMSEEFGMEEYAKLMNAQPNPNGSRDDKRLLAILHTCGLEHPR